jgi:D-alanyl-lipoteichoic acid acyltransferase DltB (MBOAT superfamily)
MGYSLPDNFRRPYMAVSFSDFWRRWHISLSSWLRDYLYIPLGGNRMKTKFGVYRNLMLTMLLGGLWHGAAWHFVLWGFLHGSYLAVEKMVGAAAVTVENYRNGATLFLKRLLVFHAVVLTWLVFRCEDMSRLADYLQALVTFNAVESVTLGMAVCAAVVLFGFVAQWTNESVDLPDRFVRMPVAVKGLVYAAAAVLIMVFNFAGPRPFIYFRF